MKGLHFDLLGPSWVHGNLHALEQVAPGVFFISRLKNGRFCNFLQALKTIGLFVVFTVSLCHLRIKFLFDLRNMSFDTLKHATDRICTCLNCRTIPEPAD